MAKIKHVLASKKDKKPTIRNSELKKFFNIKRSTVGVYLSYLEDKLVVLYHKSRNGSTWYCDIEMPEILMPTVGSPKFLEINKILEL